MKKGAPEGAPFFVAGTWSRVRKPPPGLGVAETVIQIEVGQ